MHKTIIAKVLFLCLTCLCAMCLLAATSTALADTLHVGGTDPSAYSTIQAALDDALPGDTVLVHAGTYSENIILPGGVTLQGDGADVTIISGMGVAGGPPARVITAENITHSYVTGFTITIRPEVRRSVGFYVYASSIQISRCIIRNTETGIYAAGSGVTIRNNIFYPDSGITGMDIHDTSGVIKNNIIIDYGTGIYVTGRSNLSVNYNNVFLCTEYYHGTTGGIGALSSDPLFVSPAHDDFHLAETSPCIDAGDPSDTVPPHGGSRIDMGVFEYEYLPEIVEGPQASVSSDTEVRIVWQTNTPCDSRVNFGRNAGSFDQEADESTLATTHSITLSGLSPSTTYQYFASSTDNGGSTVQSRPAYFATLPAPDTAAPLLDVNIPDQITGTAAIHAEASDDTGIESVRFYVDDSLKFTLFGSSCDWLFDPSAYSNGPHSLKVVTRDKAGKVAEQQAEVQVAMPPIDVTLPQGGIISPEAGSNVSGSEVLVEAWAMDPESGIASILFYVDDQLLYAPRIQEGEPGVEHHASWKWNSFGAENDQDHEIRVEIINNRGMAVSESCVVHVSNTGTIFDEPADAFFKFKFIKLTRGQVKRDGVYYEAKLYVKNISPVTLEDVTVYDTHTGFQAIQSDYGYAPRVRFDPDTFSSTVMYEIGDLHPGETKELTVNMSTVLVPPDPCKFDYVIGKQTEVDYLRRVGSNIEARSLIYHIPAAKVIEGWYGTEEIPLNTGTVLAPLASRDYLVVTHPRNLYSQYQIPDVDELLSELAMFVRHKNAVLAYLDTPAPRSELLNLTGHKNAVPINGAPSSGNWSHLIGADWPQNGYMLLVGETEIIPSFTIILTIPKGTYTIPLCDQPYADLNDDGYPDLVLGRVVGNSANSFFRAVHTSLGVQYHLPGFDFDASNALLISGHGKYEQSFINSINAVSSDMDNLYVPFLPNLKYHRTDYTNSESAWNAFESAFPGHDIVYFDGHGSPLGWGGVVSFGQVYNLDFGGTNPAIISLSCSTGEYEVDNDLSMGEAFLYEGAGLFIGATCMTNTGFNSNNGIAFFRDYWRPGEGIGPKWRLFERFLWSRRAQNPYNMRFVLTYNIYGDPKYGYEQSKGAGAESMLSKGDEPPAGTVLDLPSYTVTTVDDTDIVEIPEGEMLVEPGQYQVPFWIEKIAIPPGYKVQDVQLLDRSGLVTQRGLHLPVSPDDFLENDHGEPFVPEEYLWYPDMMYQWEVIPDDNGGADSTLTLMVYPFQYNTETFESRYYTHHEFSFTITESTVEITQASVEKTAVPQGQPVNVLLGLNNMGETTVTARLRAGVEPYAGELFVGGLPLHTLEIPPGQSALAESWDTTGTPDGHYKLSIVLEDEDGNVLDSADTGFTIGTDSADICFGDSEPDGDVDGMDLAAFIRNGEMESTGNFAAVFGRWCY